MIEFGLVGQTMHQIDERMPVSDLEKLTTIYRGVLESILRSSIVVPRLGQVGRLQNRKRYLEITSGRPGCTAFDGACDKSPR